MSIFTKYTTNQSDNQIIDLTKSEDSDVLFVVCYTEKVHDQTKKRQTVDGEVYPSENYLVVFICKQMQELIQYSTCKVDGISTEFWKKRLPILKMSVVVFKEEMKKLIEQSVAMTNTYSFLHTKNPWYLYKNKWYPISQKVVNPDDNFESDCTFFSIYGNNGNYCKTYETDNDGMLENIMKDFTYWTTDRFGYACNYTRWYFIMK